MHHDKEQAQMEFSRKMARVREAQEVLDQLSRQMEEASSEVEQRMKEGLSTEEYRLWAQRIDFLRDEVRRFEQIVAEREIEAEAAKKRLLDLHVQERLLERLRERALRDFQREESRRLQSELDDLSARLKRAV